MRIRSIVIGFVAVGVGLLAPAATALAAPGSAPAASAFLRGAHFSPDTPGVDVYLTAVSGGTSRLWLSSVGYGDVSGYERITPGIYAVSMRPHGAAASTPAALTWTLNAQAGQAYTAAAVGMNAQLHGIVLRDQLTPPSAGQGLVRVIQAASRAPSADIAAVGGPTIDPAAQFATSTPYTSVPAGQWQVRATATQSPTVTTTAPVAIKSGSVTSVVVLDSKADGITIRTVADAAGAGSIPTGSVDAGGGGTAGSSAPSAWRPDAAIVGLLALGCLAITAATHRKRAATR